MLLPILLVVASGMAHAVWNLFTKQSRNKSVFLWSIMMLPTILLLPSLIQELGLQSLSAEAYALMALSAVLQALYSWLLSQAYELGDLSQVYPVMRGASTLLVPLVGVILLKESLSGAGWFGIGLMLCGFLVHAGMGTRKHDLSVRLQEIKPFFMALGIGACITCYVFVDKLNLQHISPLALLEVTNIGFVAGLTPQVLLSGELRAEWKANWRTMLLGAVLNPGSYLLFLFAMQQAPMAHIGPLRETGTVFATLLGVLLLKEKQGTQRIIGSVVIAGGILIVGMWG
ncbi:SMR family transporter [Paenibacillus tuaregi]|uniref:SMR family transporter n=1 Tax=Paenibacillus tuaregi TaxID=1816681 RepID=UPI000838F468|nr:SMR family transporter [Paenibacillus tuaregi]